MKSVILLCALAASANADAPAAAADLLATADRARGGLANGVTWDVELVAHDGDETTRRSFLIKARATDAYVEALEPPRTKGEIMIFNDRTIWYTKPSLRKPVSISARQRLSGLAANGDIASTNYARDYVGTVVGEDAVDGEPAWRLELKAKATNVTYDRIRYWISKTRGIGIKAEFLTVDGAVFKSAGFEYGNKVALAGVSYVFISKMTIRDAASQASTEIFYANARAEDHPESTFNINNVAR
jgi:outer membrane lipoprotein-sorting protein